MPHALSGIAAIDFGGLLVFIFLVISFIGWLSNLIKGQQPGNTPKPQARPRNRQIQDELEAFLKDVTGQTTDSTRRGPQRDPFSPAEKVESAFPAQQPQGRQQPKKKKNKSPKPSTASTPTVVGTSAPPIGSLSTVGGQVAQRHLPAGEAFYQRQSLQTRVAPEIGKTPAISSSTSRPGTTQSVPPAAFGALSAENSFGRQGADETRRRAVTPADALFHLLRGPSAARQAILLHEILGPPRGRRRR